MTTYRVDPRQPQNVYRGEQYIGVMFTAEDAALAVEALNGGQEYGPIPALRIDPVELTPEQLSEFREAWQESLGADPEAGPCVGLCAGCPPDCPLVGDSCSCTKAGPDPACPVHQGRRARGPKPPPVGPDEHHYDVSCDDRPYCRIPEHHVAGVLP